MPSIWEVGIAEGCTGTAGRDCVFVGDFDEVKWCEASRSGVGVLCASSSVEKEVKNRRRFASAIDAPPD